MVLVKDIPSVLQYLKLSCFKCISYTTCRLLPSQATSITSLQWRHLHSPLPPAEEESQSDQERHQSYTFTTASTAACRCCEEKVKLFHAGFIAPSSFLSVTMVSCLPQQCSKAHSLHSPTSNLQHLPTILLEPPSHHSIPNSTSPTQVCTSSSVHLT